MMLHSIKNKLLAGLAISLLTTLSYADNYIIVLKDNVQNPIASGEFTNFISYPGQATQAVSFTEIANSGMNGTGDITLTAVSTHLDQHNGTGTLDTHIVAGPVEGRRVSRVYSASGDIILNISAISPPQTLPPTVTSTTSTTQGGTTVTTVTTTDTVSTDQVTTATLNPTTSTVNNRTVTLSTYEQTTTSTLTVTETTFTPADTTRPTITTTSAVTETVAINENTRVNTTGSYFIYNAVQNAAIPLPSTLLLLLAGIGGLRLRQKFLASS